jgi:hypothetical protein
VRYRIASLQVSTAVNNHVVKLNSTGLFLRAIKILLLVVGTQEEEPWCAALEYYSTYKVDQLHPVVAKLASLVKAAPSSKLKVRQFCISLVYGAE